MGQTNSSFLGELDAASRQVVSMKVAEEIVRERGAQDEKWGEQNHPDGTGLSTDKTCADYAKLVCDTRARNNSLTWRDILHEEVTEAFAETDPDKLRAELIQVAAVAAAWVEAIDRRAAE